MLGGDTIKGRYGSKSLQSRREGICFTIFSELWSSLSLSLWTFFRVCLFLAVPSSCLTTTILLFFVCRPFPSHTLCHKLFHLIPRLKQKHNYDSMGFDQCRHQIWRKKTILLYLPFPLFQWSIKLWCSVFHQQILLSEQKHRKWSLSYKPEQNPIPQRGER